MQTILDFNDPPCDLASEAVELLLAELTTSLNPEALVIVERDSRSPMLELPKGLGLESRKNYDDTSVFFLDFLLPSLS